MSEPRIFSESSTSADEMPPILSGERSLPENAVESIVCEPGAFTEEKPNTNNGNIGKERPPNEDGAYYTEHDFYDVVDTGSLERTMNHVFIDSDSDEELSGVMRLELADHTYDARSPSKRYQERNEEKFSAIVGLSEYFNKDGRPFNDRTAPAMPQLFNRMDGYSNNGSPQVFSRPDSGIVASQRTRNEFASPILRSPNQHGLPKIQPGQHQPIMGQAMPQKTGNRGLPTGVSGNSVSFTEPLSPQHTSLKDPQRLMMSEGKRPVRPPFITDANRTLTPPSNAPMLTSGRGPRQVPRGRGGSTSMVDPQRGDIDEFDDDALILEPSDGISGGHSPLKQMDFNSQLMAPISKSAASPSPISRPSWVSSQETAHSGRRDAAKPTRSRLAKTAKKLPPKSDTSAEESEEEEYWEAGCICEMDHVSEKMVECEKCKVWQHSECLEMSEDEFNRIRFDKFFCEKCSPKILRLTRMEARNMQARFLKEIASIKQNKKRVNKGVDHSSAKSSSSSRKIKLRPIKKTKKQKPLKESKKQSTYSAEAEKLLRGMPDSTIHLDIPSKPKCSSRFVDLNTYGMVAEQPFLRDDVGCELFGSICLPNECKNDRIPDSTISFIYDGLSKTGNNKKNSSIPLPLPSDSPTNESALLPPAIPIDELKRQVLHKDVGSPSTSSLRSPKSGEQNEEYTPSMSIADRLNDSWGIKR